MAKITPNDHDGHRARLRKRFVEGGHAPLPDYELLEIILFSAIPRRDVKPIAKALLRQFGDLAGVLAAPITQLCDIDGISQNTAIALKCIEATSQRMIRTELAKKPILSSWQRLLDYVQAAMARQSVEHFRVLYLNRKNMLIADEVHQTGTIDQSAVFPREILKRALELGATALVLAHNHPSGNPTPSEADLELTNEIVRAGAPLGIVVHDHLIASANGILSFKEQCLL